MGREGMPEGVARRALVDPAAQGRRRDRSLNRRFVEMLAPALATDEFDVLTPSRKDPLPRSRPARVRVLVAQDTRDLDPATTRRQVPLQSWQNFSLHSLPSRCEQALGPAK